MKNKEYEQAKLFWGCPKELKLIPALVAAICNNWVKYTSEDKK